MLDTDEFYKKVERNLMVNRLRSTGALENSMWQTVGKFYNKTFNYSGALADSMLSNIDRQLSGKKKHGFEQNKKTDLEKLIEKGKEDVEEEEN